MPNKYYQNIPEQNFIKPENSLSFCLLSIPDTVPDFRKHPKLSLFCLCYSDFTVNIQGTVFDEDLDYNSVGVRLFINITCLYKYTAGPERSGNDLYYKILRQYN
ncbi:hypothetical protein GCM10009131_12890 [Morganella psychrotolerans]